MDNNVRECMEVHASRVRGDERRSARASRGQEFHDLASNTREGPQAKSITRRNLHCLAASAHRPLRHPPRPHSDMVEDLGVSHSMICIDKWLFCYFIRSSKCMG